MKRSSAAPSEEAPVKQVAGQPVSSELEAPQWALRQQQELGNAAFQGLLSHEGPAPQEGYSALQDAVARRDPLSLAAMVSGLGNNDRARLKGDRALLAELSGLLPAAERGALLRGLGVPLPQQLLLGALGSWLDHDAVRALLSGARVEEQDRVARHGAATLLLMPLGSPLELLPALAADPARAARCYSETFFFGVWLNTDLDALSAMVEQGDELSTWVQALLARGALGTLLELVDRSPDPARWGVALHEAGGWERAIGYTAERESQSRGQSLLRGLKTGSRGAPA